jgi:quinol monooxygenase YgiN
MSVALPTIVVTASLFFRVQPQNQAEVLSIVNTIAERMRRSPSCCRNRLLNDLDDPNSFVLVSEWPDMASAEAFMLSRELQIFRGVRILLRSEPVVILDQISNRLTRVLSTD